MKMIFDKDNNGEGMKGIAAVYTMSSGVSVVIMAPDSDGLTKALKELLPASTFNPEKAVAVIYKDVDKSTEEIAYFSCYKTARNEFAAYDGPHTDINRALESVPDMKLPAFVFQQTTINDKMTETPIFRWGKKEDCWIKMNIQTTSKNDPTIIPF